MKDGQSVYFNESNIEEAVRRSATKQTTLMAFFALNSNLGENDQSFYYKDFHRYMKCENSTWLRRSENSTHGEKAIGRLVAISPKNSELYHLKLLLTKVKETEAS